MGPFSINTQLRGGGRGGEKLQLYWEPWEFPEHLICRTGQARGEHSTSAKKQQKRPGILSTTGYSVSLKVRQELQYQSALCHSNANEEQRLNLSGLTRERGPAVEHLLVIGNLGL